MKVHQYDQFSPGMLIRSSWDQQSQLIETSAPASLSSFCQRLRPLLPSSHNTSTTSSNSSTAFRFDLKSFIKPRHCGSDETNVSSSDDKVENHHLTQVCTLYTYLRTHTLMSPRTSCYREKIYIHYIMYY